MDTKISERAQGKSLQSMSWWWWPQLWTWALKFQSAIFYSLTPLQVKNVLSYWEIVSMYHVNATGVVVTNLVMDNCPVNYATFRRLYHLYFGTGKIYKFYIKKFSCNKNIQSGFVKAKINLTILWHSLFNLDHFKVAVPQVFWHSILWN